MGRHSMDYRPEAETEAVAEGNVDNVGVEASISPPDGPVDPGVPGAPEAPSPDGPSTVPATEPPPLAPDETGDGSIPVPGRWRASGAEVL